MREEVRLGATLPGEGLCRFRVWAPFARAVDVHVLSPQETVQPLERQARGYHEGILRELERGSLYMYRLDGAKERPDPASRHQPQGVHGPSEVIDSRFPWEDSCWSGIPLKDYVIYELHVGAYTPEGRFGAIIPHLDELKRLGVTAVEIMPVAQFPGTRNWGYDGVYLFAVQNSYGGPDALKRLVNACHLQGIAVVLDVVYNHLGPEGNYLWDFGPYFTDRYRTVWGSSVNFDGPQSDEVRGFFVDNALYWIREFHVDALRLDAIHGIFDFSAKTFLQALAEAVRGEADGLGRRVFLMPESALNDARVIRSPESGGYGMDAQWNDDFHHALHTLVTGERSGYYADFGRVEHLAKAFRDGYVYSGQYSVFRERKHGNSSRTIPSHRFIVFSQNHDQVGNRMLGERLSRISSFEALKLVAGCVILSPFIPLLFMGEEYGETAPFPYFIDHSDPGLADAVRRGRQEEFASFGWQGEPADPQDEKTFLRAKLDHSLRAGGEHKVLYEFYTTLLHVRREVLPAAWFSKESLEVNAFEEEKLLVILRPFEKEAFTLVLHFGGQRKQVCLSLPEGMWKKRLDSAEERWKGPGACIPEGIESKEKTHVDMHPFSFLLLSMSKVKNS
jgi:maltooligosyltrehalose trehalohydrolase